MWWSGDGFVNFLVIGVPLGEINGFSVLGIGMGIVGVQNDLSGIIEEVFVSLMTLCQIFSFT